MQLRETNTGHTHSASLGLCVCMRVHRAAVNTDTATSERNIKQTSSPSIGVTLESERAEGVRLQHM